MWEPRCSPCNEISVANKCCIIARIYAIFRLGRVRALLPSKHHGFRLNDFRRGLFKDQKNHRKTGFLPAHLGCVTNPSFYCGSKAGAILPYNPVYLDVLHQSSPVHPRVPLGALQCDNGSLCRNLLADDPQSFSDASYFARWVICRFKLLAMKLSKIKNWIPDLSFIFKKPDYRG